MAGLSVDNVMALRQSILQRNDALKGVANGVGAGSPAGAAGNADFTSALKSALSEVNNLQANAGDAATAFERGETTDIAAVMLAKQQASIGFETTLQVRNKLLSAYKDIMSMPV
ncbi:MAG: flagellar hook-basal body complex protein FliE [Sphingobium sp.]|nr:flagellar hook-basal body complex protein FliE [Sphingobium sp.]